MCGLKNSELEIIIKILKDNNVSECILFGSRAKGTHKNGSDVDLAVSSSENKISYILNEETKLPYFFDVINLNSIKNKDLINHIKRVGKIIIGSKPYSPT
ncbi:MAG: nucleotidyltransferase domain-containing protein [Desulfobacteraceae bacterium]|jgi:predicted nucleotidyltransferase|nr:nucleotidyltransferase domain-containing protein [Desulfobacteraceae bacterium]